MTVRTTRVSLAVWPTDEFSSGAAPVGPITVSLRGQPSTALKKRGGASIFTDVAAGTYTVDVQSQLYLPEDRPVTLPHANPLAPVLTVPLKPKWLYPFPEGTTLIRGMVTGADGVGLSGITVALGEKPLNSRSADDGRYVLYFRHLSDDDITVSGGRRLVRSGAATTAFTLRATHATLGTRSVAIPEVEEGRTLALAPIVFG